MINNKEAKILKAAEKVFFSQGFFPARMEDIAEKAGVAKGTLYLYFKDKTSIYIHLMNHRLEEVVTVLKTIQKKKMSATEKLGKIFKSWADYYAQAKGMTSFVSIENINLTQELMKEMETQIKPKMIKMVDTVTEIIKQGIAEHEFTKVNPKIAAIYFMSTVRAFFVGHFYHVNSTDSEKVIKTLFLNGIKLNNKEYK
jgi:TetR/AcrR family fatty acid metabolism transcriptional regulator